MKKFQKDWRSIYLPVAFLVIVVMTIIISFAWLAPVTRSGDEVELYVRPGWVMEVEANSATITLSGDEPFSGRVIFENGGEALVSSMEQDFTYKAEVEANSPLAVYFSGRPSIKAEVRSDNVTVVIRPSNEEFERVAKGAFIFIVVLMLFFVALLLFV